MAYTRCSACSGYGHRRKHCATWARCQVLSITAPGTLLVSALRVERVQNGGAAFRHRVPRGPPNQMRRVAHNMILRRREIQCAVDEMV